MEPPVLLVRGLRRQFSGVDALVHVDFDLQRGEVLAILGPNGAGKTTLLTCIAGLLVPTSGTIAVNGSSAPAARERHVAYVPEIPLVYGDLSPRQHLAFVAAGRRIANAESAIERAMMQSGMLGYADRPAGTFSKGMRQRLCLAGALVAGVDVLLFDEPTTGLDPAAQDALCDTIRGLAGDGAAIIMTTHALSIAYAVATQIAVLTGGRLGEPVPRSAYAGVDALREAYASLAHP